MTHQAQLLVKIQGKQSHLLDLNADKVAKISAKSVESLVLKNTDNDFSPENITLLRAGSDLDVILEGDKTPSLIIKDYFDMVAPPALTGVAEDFQVYVYQPSRLDFSDDSTGYSFPADKMQPALLAGNAIGDGNQMFSNPPKAEQGSETSFDSLPWFLGVVGGVVAAGGIGLAIRNHHRHHHSHHADIASQSDSGERASSSTNLIASNSPATPDNSVTAHSAAVNASAVSNPAEQPSVSLLSPNSLSALDASMLSTDSSSLPQTHSSLQAEPHLALAASRLEGSEGHTATILPLNGSDLIFSLSGLSNTTQEVGKVNLNTHANPLTVGFNDVLKMGEEHLFPEADGGKPQLAPQNIDTDSLKISSAGEKWPSGADQDLAGHIAHTAVAGNSVEMLIDAHLSHVNIV